MNLVEIGELVKNVGFPVVACLILYQLVKDQNSANRDQTQFNNELLIALRTSIDENTRVIQKLSSEVLK